MLEPVTTADLPLATQLLTEGFPERSSTFWELSLARLRQHGGNAAAGVPWGQILLERGQPVGIALTPASVRHRNGHPQLLINLSSWYVRPSHRWRALLMLRRLVANRQATYTDFTPTPTVQRILPLVGLKAINRGLLIDCLPLHAWRGATGGEVQPLPPGADLAGFAPPAELIESHRALGCQPLLLHDAQGSQLLVLQRSTVRGLPAARVVYADSNQRWRRQLGPLARHLLRQGTVCLVSDSRGGPRPAGALFRPRDIWFSRGDDFEDRTDLLGSELCLLPL